MSTMLCKILLFIFLFPASLHGIVIGSNSAVSREGYASFPEQDSDNEMRGFAAFESGFFLHDPTTSCTFNSFFPVSGPINLTGGTLYLRKDLVLDSGVTVSGLGSFYGNGYCVDVSDQITTFSIYAIATSPELNQRDVVAPNNDVNAVDWSYDDQYAMGGTDANILYVYSFDGNSFTPVDNIDALDTIFTVRTHPSGYYFAVGTLTQPAEEVRVYKLVGSSLSLTTSQATAGAALSLAWSYDGNYLACGHGTDTTVYSFVGEIINVAAFLNYGGDAVQEDTAAWDQTGSYYALGTGNSLRIFYFDGSSITSTYQLATGGPNVEALDWSKTGSFIASGRNANAGPELFVHEFNVADGTLTERASLEISINVNSVHWNSDATRLAVGKGPDGANDELQVYSFNPSTYALTYNTGVEFTTNVNSVRWSHDDRYLLTGDDNSNLTVFAYTRDGQMYPISFVTCDNVGFTFHGDISWEMPTVITGECHLNLLGNKITLTADGSLTTSYGGSLTIENADVIGITADNFGCSNPDESITLRNCKIRLSNDYEFNSGSLLFQEDVIVTGTNKFTYASNQTSTIAQKATLMFDVDTTFSYDPPLADRDLIYMVDGTSVLYLNACTLQSSSTGLRLTRGFLCLDNGVTFSSEGSSFSEAITFGDGTAANDLTVKVMADAEVYVHGPLVSQNVN